MVGTVSAQLGRSQWNSETLDVQHQSLYYQRNDRRCRLHNWSVHHSDELELLKLVRMISMSSTHFPVDLTCNISAIF